MTIESNFVYAFSFCLNVGSFIRVFNFGVSFKNKFEKGDWKFVLKVGVTTVIEQIDPFFVYLRFIFTHSILDFMQRENL